MATRVKDIDRGMKRVVKQFREANKAAVAGYPAGVPSGNSPEGTPIWLYMTYNEEGVASIPIPARPFMAQALAKNLEKYISMRDRGIKEITSGQSTTIDQVLTRIAVEMHNDIKRELLSGDFVPNADSTVLSKGSSLPLFDTGAATSAVAFEVRKTT